MSAGPDRATRWPERPVHFAGFLRRGRLKALTLGIGLINCLSTAALAAKHTQHERIIDNSGWED
jgi:hypothetical protein